MSAATIKNAFRRGAWYALPLLFAWTAACSGNLKSFLERNILKKSGDCAAHFATLYNPGRHPDAARAETAAVDGLVTVRFSEEEFDIGGFWSPEAPARLTAPADGEYTLRLRTNFQHEDTARGAARASRIIAFTVDDEIVHKETYYNAAHRSGYWPTLESSIKLKLRAGQSAGARLGGVLLGAAASDEVPAAADSAAVQALPVDINIRRVCKR